jgi:hypothetical protein
VALECRVLLVWLLGVDPAKAADWSTAARLQSLANGIAGLLEQLGRAAGEAAASEVEAETERWQLFNDSSVSPPAPSSRSIRALYAPTSSLHRTQLPPCAMVQVRPVTGWRDVVDAFIPPPKSADAPTLPASSESPYRPPCPGASRQPPRSSQRTVCLAMAVCTGVQAA